MRSIILLMLACTGCARLIATEEQRQTHAYARDVLGVVAAEGAPAGDARVRQAATGAETIEALLGAPKARLATSDVAGAETVRAKAAEQIEAASGWKKWAAGGLGLASLVLGAFGLPVGSALDSLRKRLSGEGNL